MFHGYQFNFGKNKGFPTIAVLLFVLGVFWLLSDLGYLTVQIPWWPIVLIVIAFSWIYNYYRR